MSQETQFVGSANEWDRLREVVVGTMRGARFPTAETSFQAIEFPEIEALSDVPSGPLSATIIDQTEDELDALAACLEGLGVLVHRPDARDLSAVVATPDWQTTGFYDYCPRDGFLVVGSKLIETPMALRSRIFEGHAYKSIFGSVFESGATWLAAPKPRLLDEAYDLLAPAGKRLREVEPIFDGANILRFGQDLLYLVSDSGNLLGARWLERLLGPTYRVHPCTDLYASTHVDSTVVPLKEGLVLVNPARVTDANLPSFLDDWEKLVSPEMIDVGFSGERPYCSVWIGMNLLVLEPGVVIVDDRQLPLMRFLEANGVDLIPMRLTHSRSLGGSFHCVTLDLWRDPPQPNCLFGEKQ